jgi:hypothetical protein
MFTELKRAKERAGKWGCACEFNTKAEPTSVSNSQPSATRQRCTETTWVGKLPTVMSKVGCGVCDATTYRHRKPETPTPI